MNNDIETAKNDFQEWMNANKKDLPVSAAFWTIHVVENSAAKADQIEPEAITLGTYQAKLNSTNPFYKPYSKSFTL